MSPKLKKPLGLYGGTFSPIHYGHLRPALEILEKFSLEKIFFIPVATPPHKSLPDITNQWRLKLLIAGLAAEKSFLIDTREYSREGISYTIDTLMSLKNELSDTPLCLIMGLDSFVSLPQWHRWREILDYCHLIVTQRPNQSFNTDLWPKELKDLYNHTQKDKTLSLTQHLCGKIILTEVTQLSISATDIRKRIKNNLSIRYLLPNSVYELINNNNLYH